MENNVKCFYLGSDRFYQPLFRKTVYHKHGRSSLVAQQVKDPALSLLWLRSLLWCRFDPWAGKFSMLWL